MGIEEMNKEQLRAAMAQALGAPNHRSQAGSKDPIGLSAIAEQLAETKGSTAVGRTSMIVKGMLDSDFAEILAEVSERLVNARFVEQAAHRQFAPVVPVNRFQGDQVPELGPESLPGLLPVIAEGEEIHSSAVEVPLDHRMATLRTYGNVAGISREDLISDNLGAFQRQIVSLGLSAARTESKLLIDALEDNGTLRDGGPLFHADFDNIVSASGLDATAFSAGLVAMRRHKPYQAAEADLFPQWLVVPPEGEAAANKWTRDHGLEGRCTVIGMADLAATRWYMVADADIAPVVAVLRIASEPTTIRVRANRRMTNFDGSMVRVTADLGVTVLGRAGIVRGGA